MFCEELIAVDGKASGHDRRGVPTPHLLTGTEEFHEWRHRIARDVKPQPTEYKIGVGRLSSRISGRETKKVYEGWNFNSGNYLFTTDTK